MTGVQHKRFFALVVGGGDDYAPNNLEVEVDYEKGGTSMFGGGSSVRGVYVYVRPTRQRADGVTVMTLFRGVKHLMVGSARRSEKDIARCCEIVFGDLEKRAGTVWDIVLHTLAKENLILKDPAAPPSASPFVA